MDRVGSTNGGVRVLQALGFEKQSSGEGDVLVLADDKVHTLTLQKGYTNVSDALANPFYGVL